MSDCNCKTPPTAAKETDHYADIQNSLRGVREKLVRGKAVEAAITEAHAILDASGLLSKREISHRGIADRVRDLVDRVFAANTESESLRRLQTDHVQRVEALVLKIQQLERMQPPTPPIPEANEYYQGVIVGQVKQMERLQMEGFRQAKEIATLRKIVEKYEGGMTAAALIRWQTAEIDRLRNIVDSQTSSVQSVAKQFVAERGIANRLATVLRSVVYGHVRILNSQQALEALNAFDAARRAQEPQEG